MTEAEKIKAQIAELEKRLEAVEAGYWVPEQRDNYYYITGVGAAGRSKWAGSRVDRGYLDMGNVFNTREEAEHEAKVRKAYVKFSRMPGVKKFEAGGDNWFPVFCSDNKSWVAFMRRAYCYINGIYFDSEQFCEAAIEAMGDEMDLLKGV